MIDVSLQKQLSKNVMEVYELMAEQHPEQRDAFLKATEYLFHQARLRNLEEIEKQNL